MNLSPNFTLEQLTNSQTAQRLGIDNTPDERAIANLQLVCANILEPALQNFGSLAISSGFRCLEVNRAIGGAVNSQHTTGQAVDFEVYGMDNCDLAQWVVNNLMFDQLILEFHDHEKGPNDGWVHVSFSDQENRQQVLTAIKLANGKTKYLQGIVP